ncbi:MAG: hypothetical protein KC656_01015 [Myxococcales bacterium]|nr:hypothetical protein [Myxococcales bacterium]
MFMMLLHVAHAACEEPLGSAAFVTLSAKVERAFVDRDADLLVAAAAEAEQALPCVREKLLPGDVAAYFRHQGLGAFVRQDRDQAIRSFFVARWLDPDFTFAEEVLPQGHPARRLYGDTPSEAPARTGTIPEPAEGWIAVDGRTGYAYPLDRPWVFQLFDAVGNVLETGLVVSPDQIPEVVVPPPAAPGPSMALMGGVAYQSSRVFGGGTATLTVPITGPLSGDVGLQVMGRREPCRPDDCLPGLQEGEGALNGLWMVYVGARLGPTTGGFRPYATLDVDMVPNFILNSKVDRGGLRDAVDLQLGLGTRLGAQFVVTDAVAVGGEIGVGVLQPQFKDPDPLPEGDSPTPPSVLFSPRVGASFAF